jgi:phage major head subunit gpT-like protein
VMVSIDKALDTITANWKKEGDVDLPMQGREPAQVGMEARDKFKKGAELALMHKAGLKGGERNEFTSLSLSELARESIVMAGGNGRFTNRTEMIGHAFTMAGTHTTSDFANILANIMGKSALQGWQEAPETYDMWTRKGILSDFKATKRVGVGLLGVLPALTEGEDYQYGTVGDRGEPITLATYGKMLRLSRQAIINDDLSLLGTIPAKMGRAARATIGNLVYAVLTGNPTMSDTVALFHSTHANLAGTGTVISTTSIGAARAAMRVQKESATSQPLNIIPKYLIVPAALEMVAKQTIMSTVDPAANKGHAINPVNNSAEIVIDARLDSASATAWYMAADGQSFDTIEVAYLDGNDAPYLEQQTAWTSDGVEMKVRIDAGVAPLDYRTLYKNPGA